MERSAAPSSLPPNLANLDNMQQEELLRLLAAVSSKLGISSLPTKRRPEEVEEEEELAVQEELDEWEEEGGGEEEELMSHSTQPGAPMEEELRYDEDDDAETEDVNTVKKAPKPNGKRGQNLKWRVYEKFESKEEFDASDVKTELETKFTQRKVRSTEFAEKVLFECEFARKERKKCPVKYQVNHSNSSDDILVETVGEHDHDPLMDEDAEQNRNYLKWTAEQTKIVVEGVKHNLDPTNIRRALKDSNLFLGIFPSQRQLNNKIAMVRKSLVKNKITMTADLRKAVENNVKEPEDENEAFIVDYDIKDDEGEANVRFHITWSTKKMMRRINRELAQGDATYRINWRGFPVLVAGTSTSTGKFFPWSFTLTSKEDSSVWSSVFRWMKSVLGDLSPKKVLGDGARDFTKAAREVSWAYLLRLWQICLFYD